MSETAVQRKVAVGAAVGGAVAVLTWALDTFWQIKVSGEAAVGLSTALTFVVQYAVPNRRSDAQRRATA